MITHPSHKNTAWVRHCHFAEKASTLWCEGRLTCFKKRDDDGIVIGKETQTEDGGSVRKTGNVPPWQAAMGFRERIFHLATNTLIGNLTEHAGNEEALKEYLEKNREEIIATVYEHGGHSLQDARRINHAISEETMRPADIHQLIEKLIAPKPEKDTALEDALIIHAPEKGETKEKKQSRWQKLLARIATLTHPLYRRLASFLGNRTVLGIGISIDSIFEDLRDKHKRLSLFRKLASLRHDLVLEDTASVSDRQQALEDLQAILYHGQFMLGEEEKAEFYELYSRVSAAKLMVEEEGDKYAKEKSKPKEEKAQSDALAESETIRRFLISEREQSSAIRGEKGLLMRLQKKGHELGDDNPFSILAQGLSKDEWLGALRVPEHLKYTCILIALEEIAALKHDVGLNKRRDTMNLLDRMKSTIIQLLQRGVRGFPEESAGTVFARHGTLPIIRQNFDALQKKISSEERPSRADIDEILLLYAWLSRNDNQFDADSGMKLKIEVWRENTEATSTELQNEASDARKDLAESLADTSPILADVLRDAETNVLLSALLEVEEEKAIEENRARLEHSADALPPEKLHKVYREPPLLHDACDREYAEKRLQKVRELLEQNVSLAAVKYHPIIITLDEEYEKERVLRLTMHNAFIASQEAKILAVLEADIRAKSAGLLESFSKTMGERMKKRLQLKNAGIQEIAQAIERMEWDQLPDILTEDEMETAIALGTLKTLTLRNHQTPSEAVRIALTELSALEEDVEDADERMREREETILASQESAQRIANDPKTPDELKTLVTPVAKGDVKIAGGPGAKIHTLENHRVQQAFLIPALTGQNDVGDRTSLEKRLKLVDQRIAAILPTYRFENDGFGGMVEKEIHKELQKTPTEQGIQALTAFADILEAGARTPKEIRGNAGQDFASFVATEKGIPKAEYAWAVYDREKRQIVLNGDKLDYAVQKYGKHIRTAVIAAEMRHVFNDATFSVFPMVPQELYSHLTGGSSEIPESLQKNFKELSAFWVRKGDLEDDVYREEVIDEFLSKEALYAALEKYLPENPEELKPGTPLVSKRTYSFFREMKKHHPQELDFHGEMQKGKRRRRLVAETGDADDEEVPAAPVPAPRSSVATAERGPNFQPPPYAEGSDVTANFEQVRQGFIKIAGFMKANSFYNTPKNQATFTELQEREKSLEEEFRRNMFSEEEEGFTDRVRELKENVKAIVDAISKWDTEQRDLRGAPQKPTLWHAFSTSIEFMSINDFIAIGKAIGEDIKRKHTRREQGRIGRVGISLTEWIGKTWGLREIPYINTLSAEFLRREKHAEQEEVENWKKSLEELDAYELLEILHRPSTADHMKAILLLLAERGRIIWSDTKFWEALGNFSYYKMPKEECERDENLRDDWLRKLMSDIFDKDFFRSIRTKNGAGIRSGKETYSGEADRLSNFKDGMTQELAKQLKIFVHAKHHGNGHIPDDVQPHLYEELLNYAMKNGKMTMEDKFFYLVQGIAEGLMPRDRLAVMAGEGGEGLLNIFPFIDYFYGRNNTMIELKNLAARLRETDKIESDDYYKPGPRTTMWLELEVAREESVQKRLSKGMLKRGQEADHDDMHFFIPRLDFKTIDLLTTPSGGGRPQLSDQAWMNAYSGFNSYFKSFGMVAKLEDENLGKFSSTDTQDVIRAIATFVRMDGIMVQRSAFGGAEDRRMGLGIQKLKTQRSVVNESGEKVYKERSRVDEFVKAVIDTYNLGPEYKEIMLYDVEKEGPFNEEKMKQVRTLSNTFDLVLSKKIKSDGAGKLKEVLKAFEPEFKSHNLKYDYDYVRTVADENRQSASQPVHTAA